jgi:phosphoenolpyruvate carboxykinase (ATP)
MTMHSSANIGDKDDVALFFGLSGTGKTTLSTDPSRRLIGDDEHGWSDRGVFNFEGGCYAKAINLSKESEPEIYECTRKFGTILENVAFNIDTRRVDLDDASLTENTRAAYPITHIPTAERSKIGGHPENIIMLTADAFGIMPPISRLTPEQTLYHFISGYTSKIGGTEIGLGKEPQATFSACFGAPFMALHPYAYAQLLREKIKKHNVRCWLVNTGWVGGPYGIGNRIKLKYTRQMVKAALDGTLEKSSFVEEKVFGLKIPEECQDVPKEILNPVQAWKNKSDYLEKAKELANKFRENFQQFAKDCKPETLEAGPKI